MNLLETLVHEVPLDHLRFCVQENPTLTFRHVNVLGRDQGVSGHDLFVLGHVQCAVKHGQPASHLKTLVCGNVHWKIVDRVVKEGVVLDQRGDAVVAVLVAVAAHVEAVAVVAAQAYSCSDRPALWGRWYGGGGTQAAH